ncbi:hypothetical protein VCRA2112O188_250003 [Vibrio crassostreae]|nr:hypothetical protein VCRA2112O187_140003 [Vibrio crassostreae]CAK1930067.1 hypothetical protein VCRA2112E186_230091 [Vibrio crassostreae]CAK1942160.1 hypothetical protein VCRA2113O202_250003 [Vibrio crassostreae]CAK1944527.1 hypothetical protein VCRA2112O188_250003 [Vibrio crassostreae]CAK1944833.1 hypothetical protein VCRA2113O193_250003 [Vibrio crassostreae]
MLRTFSKKEPAQLVLAQHWRSSYVDKWPFLIVEDLLGFNPGVFPGVFLLSRRR